MKLRGKHGKIKLAVDTYRTRYNSMSIL